MFPALALGGILAVGALAYHFRGVLVPFILAWILAYVLLPLVEWLEARGMSRTAAIILLYLVGAGVVMVATLYLLPGFVQEAERLTDILPSYTRLGQHMLRAAQEDVDRFGLPASVRLAMLETIGEWEDRLVYWAGTAVERAVALASFLIRLAIAPVLAFYLLRDWRYMGRRFWSWIPPGNREAAQRLAGRLDHVLSGFIRGQLLVAAVVGVMVGITAQLLGLKFSFLLGLIAGLAEIIPYFGPFIGAVPALLVAGLDSARSMVLMLVALVLIQQLESTILSPVIIGKRVGLHPLAVILALLAGGRLAGITGLLLAVPTAGILKVMGEFALDQGARCMGPLGERGGSDSG